MASFNHIAMLGTVNHLKKDILPNGTHITRFVLAADNSYINKTGEKVDRRAEISVSLMEYTAAKLARQLQNGDAIIVEGELRSHTQEVNGFKQTHHSIATKTITFINDSTPDTSVEEISQKMIKEPEKEPARTPEEENSIFTF